MIKKKRILILGGGSWGGALAQVISDDSNNIVKIWTPCKLERDFINKKNKILNLYNSNIPHQLNSAIRSSIDLNISLRNIDYLVFSIPSKFIREVSRQVNSFLTRPVHIISATKGIEYITNNTMTQIIEEEIDKEKIKSISAISGPSHAEEVIKKELTAIVLASKNLLYIKEHINLFTREYFKIFFNSDILGVQFGGALKNVLAIFFGILKQQEIGDNAYAALVTRSIYEIILIGQSLGASVETFIGLSGIGDLIATGTSDNSRNYKAGKFLYEGFNKQEIIKKMDGQVVEGFYCLESIYNFGKEKQLKLPVINFLYKNINNPKKFKNIKNRIKYLICNNENINEL